MNFGQWLLHRKILTTFDFKSVLMERAKAIFRNSGLGLDGNHFVNKDLDEIDLEAVGKPPFGDSLLKLSNAAEIFARVSLKPDATGLAELVNQWERWHVSALETISTYALSIASKRELYDRRDEKKAVAIHVAQNIVRDNDCVLILEGAAGLYSGLAIAHVRKGVTVRSSNGPLIREIRENRALAASFKRYFIVGGEADPDGVFGVECIGQYKASLNENPPATVLIVPVTGLLPDQGPYARHVDAVGTWDSVIKSALETGIRRVVFIGDHTKHYSKLDKSYGVPCFATDVWRDLLRKFQERICIVTFPTPAIHEKLKAKVLGAAGNRVLDGAASATDHDYNSSANKFAEMCGINSMERGFNETVVEPLDVSHLPRTRAMASLVV